MQGIKTPCFFVFYDLIAKIFGVAPLTLRSKTVCCADCMPFRHTFITADGFTEPPSPTSPRTTYRKAGTPTLVRRTIGLSDADGFEGGSGHGVCRCDNGPSGRRFRGQGSVDGLLLMRIMGCSRIHSTMGAVAKP